eukprot:837433_1
MAEDLPEACVPYCEISAPLNAKVNQQQFLAVTTNDSFTLQCDLGYRLQGMTTLSSMRVVAREYTCKHFDICTNMPSLAVDAMDQLLMVSKCNPFCLAIPFENSVVNGQNESLDVTPGDVVAFQCTHGSKFADGSTKKEVCCEIPDGFSGVMLHE